MKKLNLKSKNGITLVALVITIIVLIILAGISISLVLGENGILQRAREGRNNYQVAANEETVALASLEKEINELTNHEITTVYARLYDMDSTDGSTDGDTLFISSEDKEYDVEKDGTLVTNYNKDHDKDTEISASYRPVWYNDLSKTTRIVICDRISPKVTIGWFYGTKCSEIENINEIDMYNVTSMTGMFGGISNISSIDFSNYDFHNVKTIQNMFVAAKNIININFSNCDFSSLEDLTGMFTMASDISNINFSSCNFKNVLRMPGMFSSAKNISNIDFSNCDFTKLTSIESIFNFSEYAPNINLNFYGTKFGGNLSGMFRYSKLESIDFSKSNMEKITNTSDMFMGCDKLKTIYANDTWNEANIDASSSMFGGCILLEGGAGTKYSNIIDTQNPTLATYARIDGGITNPGYFTSK